VFSALIYSKYVNSDVTSFLLAIRTDQPQRSEQHSPHHWSLFQQVGNWMPRDP